MRKPVKNKLVEAPRYFPPKEFFENCHPVRFSQGASPCRDFSFSAPGLNYLNALDKLPK